MPARQCKLILKNDLQELERLTSFLEDMARDWDLDNDLLFHLNLVAEEVISNIILHGSGEHDNDQGILLEMSMDKNELVMRVTDHGQEFDPLSVALPDDLDKPASERKIGGLGVYLIRQLMDKVEYFRENDSNILLLSKKVSKK